MNLDKIDPAIRDTVAFLHRHGFNTRSSCQGGPHGDGHAFRIPNVVIEVDGGKTLDETATRLVGVLNDVKYVNYKITRMVTRLLPEAIMFHPAYGLAVSVPGGRSVAVDTPISQKVLADVRNDRNFTICD